MEFGLYVGASAPGEELDKRGKTYCDNDGAEGDNGYPELDEYTGASNEEVNTSVADLFELVNETMT